MNITVETDSGLNLIQQSSCPRIQQVIQNTGFVAKHSSLAIALINIPLAVAALLANIAILIALRKTTSVQPLTKLLFRNLACTDLCVGLVSQPMFIFHLMVVSRGRWDLCPYTEKFGYIPSVALGGVTLCTVTAISVDRLLVLLKGMSYKQVATLARVRFLVVMIWISSVCTGVSFLWNIRIFFAVSCIGITNCLAISTFCYTKIFLILRRQQERVNDNGGQQPKKSSMTEKKYKQSVFTALLIHFTLIACYLPYTTVKTITTFAVITPNLLIVEAFLASLVYLNSTLNPVLYCWRIKEVRYRIKDTLDNLC
ncbi:hypothetical protein ACROYT_G002621 [Oculina patagonica]